MAISLHIYLPIVAKATYGGQILLQLSGERLNPTAIFVSEAVSRRAASRLAALIETAIETDSPGSRKVRGVRVFQGTWSIAIPMVGISVFASRADWAQSAQAIRAALAE